MLIVCMPMIKLSYIRAEYKHRKPISLLHRILLQILITSLEGTKQRKDTILPQADGQGFARLEEVFIKVFLIL
jgi:hypothetical protein